MNHNKPISNAVEAIKKEVTPTLLKVEGAKLAKISFTPEGWDLLWNKIHNLFTTQQTAHEEEREKLLLSVNIPALVEKMKEEIQEHGDMHGEFCAVNMEDPDACNCEEMEFWGSQIAHYMAQVNDWWATHAKEHRKYCTPEGNKSVTRMLGKKNRNLSTLSNKDVT